MRNYRCSCMLGLCLLSILPLFSQNLSTENKSGEKSKLLSKTGLFFSLSIHNELWKQPQNAQPFFNGLEDCRSFNFGVFQNLRLMKTLYYQPELSYAVYNGPGEHRLTMISLVPLQIQLGYHLGWVRPFVSGACFGNLIITARQSEGSLLPMNGLAQRSAWGFYYGGGLDIISAVQLNFKLLHWMEGFDNLRPGPLREYQLGLAFLF
ncbi:MAG: hypothetical protein PHF38_01775 [Bacteroidales bacterium]|nr:hypothetical protein [Bacteroidales bacterium]MDD4361019.1 hypothetical protein [Bacteroidales bacterium]MDD4430040.1 hypothetical protein [Bacteroidales bacterium]